MNIAIERHEVVLLLAALATALVISFAATPLVKILARRIGAIDVPRDGRRMHDHPIPRLGGLAVFIGFVLSTLLFAGIDMQVRGMLIGCAVIAATGAIDDTRPMKWWVKLLCQLVAAVIAVCHGIRIEMFTNPVLSGSSEWLVLGWLSIPITIFWIVLVTNSVNLIDGLDGLAVGVSAIGSVTMLIIALLVSEGNVAIIMAALAGACIGFIPYNFNPAKIFAGDSGALLLGFVLANMSVIGLFKTYALVSFILPFFVLALPLFDTIFAIIRRLAHGQNPMQADRGHVHHRLIDMGLNQKQAVAILYCVSIFFGVAAVMLTTSGKVLFLILAFLAIAGLACFVLPVHRRHHEQESSQPDSPAPPEDENEPR